MTQTSVPFRQGDERHNTMRAFKALFTDATWSLATIPTYAGRPMAFGWGTGTDGAVPETPQDVLQGRFDAAGMTPDYYTPAMRLAVFALPGYVARLMP